MALNSWSVGCKDDIELILLTLAAAQSVGITGVLYHVPLSVAEDGSSPSVFFYTLFLLCMYPSLGVCFVVVVVICLLVEAGSLTA